MRFAFPPKILGAVERIVPRQALQRFINPPGQSLTQLVRYLHREPSKTLAEYQQELLKDDILRERYFWVAQKGWLPKVFHSWEDRFGDLYRRGMGIAWYYAMIRELKPQRVIETGTAAGTATSIMLSAIAHNGSGKLISIDLPAVRGKNTMDWSLPEGQKAGLLIPEEYKRYWELRSGDAKDLLIPALREAPCDLFIHDSLHTYEHMLWEYVTAFSNMRDGTIMMSDDTFWNRAWWDFTRLFNLKRFQDLSNPNIGVTVIHHS